jgi:hypothetical protein
MSKDNLAKTVAITAGLAIGLTGGYISEHELNSEEAAIAAAVLGGNLAAGSVAFSVLKQEEEEE